MAEEGGLVLRFGLSHWWKILAFGALLVLCGGSDLLEGRPSGWLWLAGVAALFGVYVWAVTAPRTRLHLSAAGFAYGTMRRRYFFRWADVTQFWTTDFAARRWVVFAFVPGYSGDERVRRINQKFRGFDRFLPDTYGLRAAALADLMEEWRLRHTKPAEPSAAPDPAA
jgi:hypothetical protein